MTVRGVRSPGDMRSATPPIKPTDIPSIQVDAGSPSFVAGLTSAANAAAGFEHPFVPEVVSGKTRNAEWISLK
jgi:hypothetical protein